MSDWGWVAAGFGVAYGSIAVYLVTLRHRTGRLRARSEEAR